MNCATCKFWGKPHEDIATSHRKCNGIPMANIGMSAEDDDPEVIELGQTPAFTEDGSRYRADLYTLADFGCKLWQEKA